MIQECLKIKSKESIRVALCRSNIKITVRWILAKLSFGAKNSFFSSRDTNSARTSPGFLPLAARRTTPTTSTPGRVRPSDTTLWTFSSSWASVSWGGRTGRLAITTVVSGSNGVRTGSEVGPLFPGFPVSCLPPPTQGKRHHGPVWCLWQNIVWVHYSYGKFLHHYCPPCRESVFAYLRSKPVAVAPCPPCPQAWWPVGSLVSGQPWHHCPSRLTAWCPGRPATWLPVP